MGKGKKRDRKEDDDIDEDLEAEEDWPGEGYKLLLHEDASQSKISKGVAEKVFKKLTGTLMFVLCHS